ncbi:uracil-DNA glycosylase family protein [Glaciecola sp. XM2]|uniref:uracil-DNA glycosylase family protein n=1 Tax=Glaciecola sp. XM2 TaxID=1914931 RepID=UPI002032BBA0|nr:uracil-DNA glycosylase family protein [Glaciecola sp. XM2]
MNNLQQLREQANACKDCAGQMPHAPNPVFVWPDAPKIILISQAPGRLAHASSIAWNDASGERLRGWLRVERGTFYESGAFAVLPMGFCFPGYKNGADAPPLKACAPKWHHQFLSRAKPSLTIFVGRYAQQSYLPQYKTLTEAVSDFENLLPARIVLPHPSGRNNRWLAKHNWFEGALLPSLKQCVAGVLSSGTNA